MLGISAPSSNTLDARIVEEYIRSHAMVEGLRERYGFDDAYARFSLDPLSVLPQGANRERATRFWRDQVRIRHDPASQSPMWRSAPYAGRLRSGSAKAC